MGVQSEILTSTNALFLQQPTVFLGLMCGTEAKGTWYYCQNSSNTLLKIWWCASFAILDGICWLSLWDTVLLHPEEQSHENNLWGPLAVVQKWHSRCGTVNTKVFLTSSTNSASIILNWWRTEFFILCPDFLCFFF